MSLPPYRQHLQSSDDLVTTCEATRTGFVSLALERNRRATPLVAEARALHEAASRVAAPADLLGLQGIEAGLLCAAGLSDKALGHLQPGDRQEAIRELIENFLEPAGAKFVEELVFRFLLTRGDTLGGSMRNIGGVLAQRKLTRAILATLKIAGIPYRVQYTRARQWLDSANGDAEVEPSLRGICWQRGREQRTIFYNLTIPPVGNNVDMCLFALAPENLSGLAAVSVDGYLAIGELKGGIDPAGADEHWKTARAALDRIRDAFPQQGAKPRLFFVGAAIEKKMSGEIWGQLLNDTLSNAANLNDETQVASLSRWLCTL